MADIIRLLGSPHERTQGLLSWYANGTLDEDDRAVVEAHLPSCAECQADLAFERQLGPAIASLPMDEEHGWAALAGKLDTAPQRAAPVGLLQRRVSVGWMAAGQLAGLAAMLLIVVNVALPRAEPVKEYHALGAAASAETGNLIVIFHPDVTEHELRATLLKTDARVVDGPNASGAYVLRVRQAERDATVAQLRHMPEILLAEPVDAESRQ